ncbi:MAG: hypothetical protein LBD41_06285 [Clostridiales Family XIII bacterium]|jgi:ABC-type lipoprotein release transport system permease subunit|nr:hypothetical protein [Clostridiales Family XIII bacterium]
MQFLRFILYGMIIGTCQHFFGVLGVIIAILAVSFFETFILKNSKSKNKDISHQ